MHGANTVKATVEPGRMVLHRTCVTGREEEEGFDEQLGNSGKWLRRWLQNVSREIEIIIKSCLRLNAKPPTGSLASETPSRSRP